MTTNPPKSKAKASRVVLFGNAKDPQLKDSIKKIAVSGRAVSTEPRASFDTGIGMCGNHLCSCKHTCAKDYQGDQTV
jgi:hypothetical protein